MNSIVNSVKFSSIEPEPPSENRDSHKYPRRSEDFLDFEKLFFHSHSTARSDFKFSRSSAFVAQGSCFALNLARTLISLNFRVELNDVAEVVNTPLANLNYFIRVGKKRDAASVDVYNKIQSAQFLIFTVGVAPVWRKESTGDIVLTPDKRNLQDYKWIFPRVDAQTSYLKETLRLIKVINPSIKVFLTLSPVALFRSFNLPILQADSVSKSILRASIFDIQNDPSYKEYVEYFPAFELVRWAGAHRGDVYGTGEGGVVPREVSPTYIKQVINAFIQAYLLD